MKVEDQDRPPPLPGFDDDNDEVPRYHRPWEEPVIGEADGETAESGNESEPRQESSEEQAEKPFLDDEEDLLSPQFSEADYLTATTHEYRGLAELISQAGDEPMERQAVAASMAGVGSGLVGFEDVTGESTVSEEEMELVEQARTSDLTMRVLSALVLIGLFLGTLALGGWWFTLFVTAVMILALGEFYATLRRLGYSPVALFGLIGALASPIAVHVSGVHAIPGVVVAVSIAVFLFFSLVGRRRPLENAAITIFGMAWIVLLGFAVAIGRAPQAMALVLMTVGMAAIFDTGSYFFGRGFGKHPFSPVLSPQKTVEGYIGGIVITAGVGAVLSTIDWFPVDLAQSLTLSLIVVTFSPLGDAAESMLKRYLGVKDMGSVIPGHGGMLDRVDGLLFVIPAAYLLFLAIGVL
jgi:phosphatidate cytidylyltransferase